MVIALAKKEELIYVQDRAGSLRLPGHHAGLRLCQAIRDEAHRFAQLYHHILRSKKVLGEKAGRRKKSGKALKVEGADATSIEE
jgi:excinuclease ABC subunit C